MTTLIPDDAATASQPALFPRSLEGEPADTYIARRFTRLSRTPKKIEYEFTDDAGLVHQYCHLREDMFISVWGLKHFSGTKDLYDDISEVLVARQGLHVVAGGRLTVATPEHPQALPMEGEDLQLKALFPELNLSTHTYGEFSRLAILPEFRGGVVFPEIARRFIKKAIADGVDYAFNIAPLPLARSYRQTVQVFGLNWQIRNDIHVPERAEYEGIRMVLSVMDLTKYVRKSPQQTQREAVIAD